MKKLPITTVILTLNEGAMLAGCLDTLGWCEDIIIADQESQDNTTKIAKQFGAQVHTTSEQSFAKRRYDVLTQVKTEWVLYIDADERVTPALVDSIALLVNANAFEVGLVSRKNYYYGEELHHGGWLEPGLARVFKKSVLQSWQGDIHETPVYSGKSTQLTGSLWHFSHRSVIDGLIKSARWTPMEARLLFDSGLANVTPMTVLRKGLGEVWRRGFRQRGYQDGHTGMMEIIIQAINRMLVYIQVWELQRKPPISQKYHDLEKEIAAMWKDA